MTGRRRLVFLALVAAQLLIPVGMVAAGELHRTLDRTILLEVRPVDPLDPFRGEYVDLRYAISSLQPPPGTQAGRTVYVPLRLSGPGWTGSTVVTSRPAGGTVVRGTFTGSSIRFGIETFYVPDGAAARYDRALFAHELYAQVSLEGDGTARLDRLEVVAH